jgi:PKD repeat protein
MAVAAIALLGALPLSLASAAGAAGTASQSTVTPAQVRGPGATVVDQTAVDIGSVPTWSNVTTAEGPGPRTDAAAAFDPQLGGMLMFGGKAPNGSALGDTWVSFDGNWAPRAPQEGVAGPLPRWGAALTYVSVGGYVLMFGGRNLSTVFSDSWIYNSTGWHALSLPGSPSARSFAALSYDPALAGAVLFGGLTAGPTASVSNQTWLYQPKGWTDLSAQFRTSPPARAWAGEAYDSSDGYLILFGGAVATTDAQPLAGTWSLGADGWTEASTEGPSPAPRVGESLAFDAQTGSVVLFGGSTVTPSGTAGFPNDTWAFKAGTWTNLTRSLSIAPAGRQGAVWSAFSQAGGLLLYGGDTGGAPAAPSDAWQFSVQALAVSVTATPTAGPAPLNVSFVVVISGGSAPYTVDWWFGDGANSTALGGVNHVYVLPGNFTAKINVTDSAGDSSLESIPISVLTSWEGAHQWSNVGALGTSAPSPRASAQIAYDPALEAVILFGGMTAAGAPASDTWEFVDNIWINLTSSLPTSPSGRYGGAMVYDSVDAVLLLFGGTNGSVTFNDTWAFDGATWTPLHISSSPSPRAFAQMAYDPLDGYVLLFGGLTTVPGVSPSIASDTWEFRGGVWVNITSQLSIAPPPTAGGTLVWDLQDSDLVLSGGSSIAATGAPGTCYPNGLTWTYVGGAWIEQDSAGPTERLLGMAAYDPVDHVVLVYGGSESAGGTCSVGADTWSYVGGGWSNLSGTMPFPPAARDRGGMVFDAAEGVDVLFGGSADGLLLNDTWLYPAELNSSSTTTTTNTTGTGGDNSSHPPPGTGPSGNNGGAPTVAPFAVGYSLSAVSSTGPLTVTFVATALGGDPPFVFSWNFGDSSPTTNGSPVSHRYTVAGTFVPVLTASDANGELVVAVLASIHVSPNPSSGLGLAPASVSSGPSLAEWATIALVAGGAALAGVVFTLRKQEMRQRAEGDDGVFSFE